MNMAVEVIASPLGFLALITLAFWLGFFVADTLNCKSDHGKG
jgi:hypothetical protein